MNPLKGHFSKLSIVAFVPALDARSNEIAPSTEKAH